MTSSLIKLIKILIFVLTITSCQEYKCEQLKIKSLGTVQYRISYANHLSLSNDELDSIQKSDPAFDLTYNDPKPELLKYLNELGLVKNNSLVLKKIDTLFRDTAIIQSLNNKDYSLFTGLDSRSGKTFFYISNDKCKDSLYLDNSLSMPRIRVFQINNNSHKLILIFWQFYFMNGDMFDIALFETQ